MAYCGPRGIPLSVFLEWDAADQDAALAWSSSEAQKCPGCGTHPEDWRDDDQAFHAHNIMCPGCARRAVAGKADEMKLDGMLTQMARGAARECDVCN